MYNLREAIFLKLRKSFENFKFYLKKCQIIVEKLRLLYGKNETKVIQFC